MQISLISILVLVKNIRSDLTWNDICEAAIPYFVSTGKNGLASCRACGHSFEKNELRIRTKFLRKLASGSILPCEISMCIDLRCLTFLHQTATTIFKPSVRLEIVRLFTAIQQVASLGGKGTVNLL